MDTYAITARPSFEALEPRLLLSTGPILGDINGDGLLNTQDLEPFTAMLSGMAEDATELGIITPTGAGQIGGDYFPLQNAFDNQPTWDSTEAEPVGPGGEAEKNNAPYWSDRYGYIDFGANYNSLFIFETWTQYRPWGGDWTSPYQELWWDDDNVNTTNEGGASMVEDTLNFVKVSPGSGSEYRWQRDVNTAASPVTPKARYLILHSNDSMKDWASEYAFVGYTRQTDIITIAGAGGVSMGGGYFPLEYAFDGQPTWDSEAGEPVGGEDPNAAPSYRDRHGYIDFGLNWAQVSIQETWTQYRPWSSESSPYTDLYWTPNYPVLWPYRPETDEDKISETTINFVAVEPEYTNVYTWVQDVDTAASPVTPKARYLIMHSPDPMNSRASEYAIVGLPAFNTAPGVLFLSDQATNPTLGNPQINLTGVDTVTLYLWADMPEYMVINSLGIGILADTSGVVLASDHTVQNPDLIVGGRWDTIDHGTPGQLVTGIRAVAVTAVGLSGDPALQPYDATYDPASGYYLLSTIEYKATATGTTEVFIQTNDLTISFAAGREGELFFGYGDAAVDGTVSGVRSTLADATITVIMPISRLFFSEQATNPTFGNPDVTLTRGDTATLYLWADLEENVTINGLGMTSMRIPPAWSARRRARSRTPSF